MFDRYLRILKCTSMDSIKKWYQWYRIPCYHSVKSILYHGLNILWSINRHGSPLQKESDTFPSCTLFEVTGFCSAKKMSGIACYVITVVGGSRSNAQSIKNKAEYGCKTLIRNGLYRSKTSILKTAMAWKISVGWLFLVPNHRSAGQIVLPKNSNMPMVRSFKVKLLSPSITSLSHEENQNYQNL